ncbi:MAG: hypothetical protein WAK29_22995 [Terriglobales bacterium]
MLEIKLGDRAERLPQVSAELLERLDRQTTWFVCVCFGLPISEAPALKWGDVNWLNGKPGVERAV